MKKKNNNQIRKDFNIIIICAYKELKLVTVKINNRNRKAMQSSLLFF